MAKAIRPDFMNLPSLKLDGEAKEKGATEEERALYGMYNTGGWKLFEERAEKLISDMEQLNDVAVANGLPYEELGKNTVVISLAKGVLRKLLNLVSDAKEACERGGV